MELPLVCLSSCNCSTSSSFTDSSLLSVPTDHKPGFDGEIAKQDVETGNNCRHRPREKKDIRQEALAVRISKIRKEG